MHLAVFVSTSRRIQREWKRRESNLRNKWRNFGAKNMSKGSVWKARCVGFKSLPSRIYSRRCRMQHHSLRPRSRFAKRSDGFAIFPQPHVNRAVHIDVACPHILISWEKLLRECVPFWQIGRHEKGVTKIIITGDEGAGSKCHFSGVNGEILDNACGSAR